MGTFHVELINHSVDSHRTADEFQLHVCWVVVDEVVVIEVGHGVSPDAAGHSGNVVNLSKGE